MTFLAIKNQREKPLLKCPAVVVGAKLTLQACQNYPAVVVGAKSISQNNLVCQF